MMIQDIQLLYVSKSAAVCRITQISLQTNLYFVFSCVPFRDPKTYPLNVSRVFQTTIRDMDLLF